MKIEIGESLLVSWLKHIKECQIVQTNWKASSKWELQRRDELETLMSRSSSLCLEYFGYEIYKKTSSLEQLLMQAEIDILGVNFSIDNNAIYAIDVAFHESGLNYGSREESVARVIKKIIRTTMCLHGYFDTPHGEVIFASPKITPAVNADLDTCLPIIRNILADANIHYGIRIIANEDFNDKILSPVLNSLDDVADTSELFMRSLQLYNMFAGQSALHQTRGTQKAKRKISSEHRECIQVDAIIGFEEMKVGVLARTVLRPMLESGKIPTDEVELLQRADYSKSTFDLQYPLLVAAAGLRDKRPERYYAQPLKIHEKYYFMCSEWFETVANNDHPYLIKWLQEHSE